MTKPTLVSIIAACILHLAVMVSIISLPKEIRSKEKHLMRMVLRKTEPKKLEPVEVKKEEAKKIEPLRKFVHADKKNKKDKVLKKVEPVLGVHPNSVSKNGKIAAPLGNTQMTEDKGIRLKKEEIDPLQKDLSSDLKLIIESVIVPKYTEAALDANLEGVFAVQVHVNAKGEVDDAEIDKKVGYGMDAVLIEAARRARFEAKKDKVGNSVAAWTSVQFNLRID